MGYPKNFRILCKSVLARLKGVQFLIIGDSHASFMINGAATTFGYSGRFASYWCGPLLAYSVGRDGFVDFELKILVKVLKPRALLYLFGEIDVRTRLGDKSYAGAGISEIANMYAARVSEFSQSVGIETMFILEPRPPISKQSSHAEFPVVGDLIERIHAQEQLSTALQEACSHHEITYIRFPAPLLGQLGELPFELSCDGCHLDCASNKLWQEFIRLKLRLTLSSHGSAIK